jgi:hypothetical protein
MYEKFKKELESSKKTNENKMKNITLKSLLEVEDFQAKSKETGKLVHFKSKDAYQAALKAGTHEDPKAKKGEQPKAAAKSNSMFGADYSKDRGAKPASKSNTTWMDDLDSIDTSDIKGKADPNADSFTSGDLYGATFKDPQTGKTITVGDAYEREDDSPAYQKAFAYVAKFDPDKEAVMGTQAYADLQKKATPKADVKSIVKGLLKTADKEFKGVHKLKDIADDLNIDDTDGADGNMLQVRIDRGEDGVYVQTDETEGVIVFNDGSQYKLHHVEDGPIPVTRIDGNAPKSDVSSNGQTDDELYDALYDMGYDFGELGSDDFDEEGFADAAMNLGYRYDDKNKVWNHRDKMKESSTKLTSMIKR